MKKMNERFALKPYGPHLWTRERAKEIRSSLIKRIERLDDGEAIAIDAAGIEVFDFSFANEFFGKTVMSMSSEFPGRFVVVENLTKYARENLEKALEGLQLAMVERHGTELRLLGKTHPTDRETFAAIVKAGDPVTAAALKDRLELNLTTMNERLSKLAQMGLIYRTKSVSPAGREQYEYQAPA